MAPTGKTSPVVPFAEPIWYTRGRNSHYNESHERLRDAVRAYVEEKITPNCAEWEEQGFVPKEVCSITFILHTLVPLRPFTRPSDVHFTSSESNLE